MPRSKDKKLYTSDTLETVEKIHEKYFGKGFQKYPSKKHHPDVNAKGLACMKDILESVENFDRALACTPEEAKARALRTIEHLERQLKHGSW